VELETGVGSNDGKLQKVLDDARLVRGPVTPNEHLKLGPDPTVAVGPLGMLQYPRSILVNVNIEDASRYVRSVRPSSIRPARVVRRRYPNGNACTLLGPD